MMVHKKNQKKKLPNLSQAICSSFRKVSFTFATGYPCRLFRFGACSGFYLNTSQVVKLKFEKNNKLLDTAAKVTTNIFNSSLNKPNLVWLYFASGVL